MLVFFKIFFFIVTVKVIMKNRSVRRSLFKRILITFLPTYRYRCNKPKRLRLNASFRVHVIKRFRPFYGRTFVAFSLCPNILLKLP